MLKAGNISLNIALTPLLKEVNLHCSSGSITALMGPNGAGKTSLLRVLTHEYPHFTGKVLLNGRPMMDWKPRDRARMMAVLPQQSSLDFPFTVEEVVNLGRIPHATGIQRDKEIVYQALQSVDAEYLSGRNYPNLSGGEKQRVQLARVLAQIWEPPVIEGETRDRLLLLDEPSASFDLAHQQLLKDIVRRVAGEGVTVVMVVHDFNLCISVSGQVVVLCCGAVEAAGNPVQVINRELVESVFGVQVEVIAHPTTGKPLIVS